MLFFLSLLLHIMFLCLIFIRLEKTLGDSSKTPTLESFCDSLIEENDKLLHLGVIRFFGGMRWSSRV